MDLRARFPEPLHAEAAAYARSVGISLNGLLMVALRDYLDARRVMPKSGEPSAPAPALPPAPALTPVPVTRGSGGPEVLKFPAPKSRADPCPCGARDAEGFRVKWKHCHGRGFKEPE